MSSSIERLYVGELKFILFEFWASIWIQGFEPIELTTDPTVESWWGDTGLFSPCENFLDWLLRGSLKWLNPKRGRSLVDRARFSITRDPALLGPFALESSHSRHRPCDSEDCTGTKKRTGSFDLTPTSISGTASWKAAVSGCGRKGRRIQ